MLLPLLLPLVSSMPAKAKRVSVLNSSRFAHTVLVCGSPTYDNMAAIREQLDLLPEGTLIVHTCAEGADWLTTLVVAQSEGQLTAIGIPANYKFGDKASVFSNIRLLDEFKPDACLAFHDKKLEDAEQAFDMVERVEKLGVPVRVVGPKLSIRQQVEWRQAGVVE